MRAFLLLSVLLLSSRQATAQSNWYQYFEMGTPPTTYFYPLKIQIDTSQQGNIWQIGRPQKILFNLAFSIPNAIVTDTLNTYPINDTSSFQYAADSPQVWPYGIGATGGLKSWIWILTEGTGVK